jgi:hypothetical protein
MDLPISNERASGAERRALREIEQERTTRAVAEKNLEAIRSRLAETEHQAQAKALEFVTVNTQVTAELDSAKVVASTLTETVDTLTKQLQVAQQQASQFKAESDTSRNLVENFRPAAPVKATRNKRGTL